MIAPPRRRRTLRAPRRGPRHRLSPAHRTRGDTGAARGCQCRPRDGGTAAGAGGCAAARQQPARRAGVLLVAAAMLAVFSAAVGAGTVTVLRPGSVDEISPQRLIDAVGAADSPGSVQAVAAAVLPSVVTLQTGAGEAVTQGSGVVIRGDGLIVTNSHVVAAAGPPGRPGQARASFADGTTAPFTVVGADPVDDIAVVRVHGMAGLTPIRFGSSATLRVGQRVVAVGAPLGLQGSLSAGVISALHRQLTEHASTHSTAALRDAIQTDAAMNPGSSGGALVDLRGTLVGISTAIASPGEAALDARGGSIGINFAIPAERAQRVAERLTMAGTPEVVSKARQTTTDVRLLACGPPTLTPMPHTG